jgi:hypothetical protein
MGKVNKSQPDKFMKIVKKAPVEAPPPLGEAMAIIDWELHLKANHRIRSFSKIVDDGKGNKQVLMNKPNAGMIFIIIKEQLKDGPKFLPFHWVWIYCVEEKTGKIAFKENTGNVDFIDWDIPEVKKMEIIAK